MVEIIKVNTAMKSKTTGMPVRSLSQWALVAFRLLLAALLNADGLGI